MTNNQEKQAIKVLESMVSDRGYKLDYIDKEYGNMEQYVIKGKNENNMLLCFIIEEEKLNIKGIKDKISIMKKEGSDRCIIVYRNGVTASAKKSIETTDQHFELFGIHELQLNITQHRLVPKHEKVSDDEKDLLEKKFKGKLPTMLVSDAVSRYYCYQRGDYIRITRKDGSVLYRFVK